jgi:hypothetical protein
MDSRRSSKPAAKPPVNNRGDDSLPLIELIGDEAENFYHLGLKDKDSHALTMNQIKALIKFPVKALNPLWEGLLTGLLKRWSQDRTRLNSLRAYAEGLSIPFEEALLSFMVPELMSCAAAWTPSTWNPLRLLGCSSFATLDAKTKTPLHGRILDFSLVGSWDRHERALFTRFTNQPAILSYGTSGVPYSYLTAMTDRGTTLAIHQKMTDVMDLKGDPLFVIARDALINCHSADEAISFFKAQRSITTWAFYMTFKEGTFLKCDLMGDRLEYRVEELKVGKILYVNNKLEMEDAPATKIPQGFDHYNQMREDNAHHVIKKMEKKQSIDEASLFLGVALPDHRKTTSQNWTTSYLTPSTLSYSTFHAASGSSYYVNGPAPKFLTHSYTHFKNAWQSLEKENVELSSRRTPWPENYVLGMRYYATTQKHFDLGDISNCYHDLQQAIAYLDGHPEKVIAQFYFLVFRYMYEPNNEMLPPMLLEFSEILKSLPHFLQDHCRLFLARLERIQYGKTYVEPEHFENEVIREIFLKELKIPRLGFRKITASLTLPRLEMPDIHYLHV